MDNLSALSASRDGVYWRVNAQLSVLRRFRAPLSAAVSAISGYALAEYRFHEREAIFGVLLTGC